MPTATYHSRKSQLETYFDRTAVDAWAKLTTDAPVGSIRATVRAGRDRMRAVLLGYLPDDLAGARLLDAGCGTGALAVEAARRGADVVAVDISPTLIRLAEDRNPKDYSGHIRFIAGDMLDEGLGAFDFVVAMDSLIHYRPADVLSVLERLSPRVAQKLCFTFAPRTPALQAMHTVGKLFPKGNRSPAIVPISPAALSASIHGSHTLASFRIGHSERVQSGFYTSQAMELVRS